MKTLQSLLVICSLLPTVSLTTQAAETKARGKGTASTDASDASPGNPLDACVAAFKNSGITVVEPNRDAVDMFSVYAESHSLRELLNNDPAKNLAYQHPAIVMNASQRVESWLRRYPARQVVRPGFGGGQVNHFPLFQDPMSENGNTFIIGQYDAVQAFVDSNHASALGDGAAVKTLTFEGGAGTGKTLFIDILGRVSRHMTVKVPDFYMYSFEWVDLKNIPELYDLLRMVPEDPANPEARNMELPIPSAIYESPFALLPAGYQDAVLKMAGQRVVDLSGVRARPPREPNPQNAFIRRAIIEYYAKQAGKETLTPDEIVAVLDKHVRIKRYVLGVNGKNGKIGYQGKDIDWGGLVFTENPLIKSLYGPEHPFAYHYNGKILQCQGGFLLWDEFWRNETQLRDFTLDVQESRIVQRGGAPAIKLDVVMAAASNSESIAKVLADGTSKAQMDRARIEPMRYSLDPSEIGRTMLMMKDTSNLKQVRLAPSITPELLANPPQMEGVDIYDLYPMRSRKNDPYEMPERRFGLYYDNGPGQEPTLIAPWTLALIEFMASVSRMETSQQDAIKVGQHYSHTVNEQVFKDPLMRLKAILGEIDVPAARSQELHELALALKEGNRGISTRDAANIWLTEVLNQARRPENENTATPYLAAKVFRNFLLKGEFKPEGNQGVAEWMQLLDKVINEMIVPSIEADINMALGQGSSDIDGAYDEIVKELIALSDDDTAEEYQGSGGMMRINKDRLRELQVIYFQLNREPLIPQRIINMHAAYATTGSEKKRHPGLLRAIQQYHANLVTKQVSFSSLAQMARNNSGDQSVRDQYDQLVQAMKYTLGYNRRAIRDSIELIERKKSATRQVGQ